MYYSEEIEEDEAVELSNMYSEEIEEEAIDLSTMSYSSKEIEEGEAVELSKMEEGRGVVIRGSSSTNSPVDEVVPEEDEDLHVSSILKKLDSITQKGGLPKDYCIRKRRTQQERKEYLQAQTSRPYYVSIGPYYHGDSNLATMENAKWKCLRELTTKMSAETREAFLKGCLRGLKKSEEQVRKFYLEDEQTKKMTTNRFVEMILLDVSFILIFIQQGLGKVEEIKEIITREDIQSVISGLYRDLLLMDNQIPFYIIEYMWVRFDDKSDSSSDVVREFDFLQLEQQPEHPPHLISGMRGFFFRRFQREGQMSYNQSFQHILHFFHHSIGVEKVDTYEVDDADDVDDEYIPSATELEKQGMKFQLKKNRCSFLDITFENGILRIPKIYFSHDRKDILQNLLDFERSYSTPSPVSFYVCFMASLLRNPSDANILIRAGIIVEYVIGSVVDIPKFLDDLKGPHELYTVQSSLYRAINKYHTSKLTLWKGALVRSYRDNPLIIFSLIGGSMILIMTFLQTFYTIFSYHHPTN